MQILAADIGTMTQAILLFDSAKGVIKLCIPSQTVLLARAIEAATRRGDDVYLTGVTMGGGPCAQAVRSHIGAGRRVYATQSVAYTFGDDLDAIRQMGIAIVQEGEHPSGTVRLEMRDFDLAMIEWTFKALGVHINPDAIALAVFDHGMSGIGGEGRSTSRFVHLRQRVLDQPHLVALACMRPHIPLDMSRMRAVAASSPPTIPLMVMDPAFAALFGAFQDPAIGQRGTLTLCHLGSMHTLVVRLRQGEIAGFFEHHTARLSPVKLEHLVRALSAGSLTAEMVSDDQGHGGLILDSASTDLDLLVVSGSRYNLLTPQLHQVAHFSMPCGETIFTGCYGLVCAYAAMNPEWAPMVASLVQSVS